eukprot:SAG11_NODE_10130_length_852_cov_2.658699_1_plen_79_part_00
MNKYSTACANIVRRTIPRYCNNTLQNLWHGYAWTQRNQQQYEDEAREVMMAETWCGVDDMAAFIFAMMDIEYGGEDWT